LVSLVALVSFGVASDGKKRGEGAVAVQFESYFVDPVYQSNPKDFSPSGRSYQYTIARK
jgi:hypothetical protein